MKTDRKKLWKYKKEVQEDYLEATLAATGRGSIRFSPPGNPSSYEERPAPYNPLELE